MPVDLVRRDPIQLPPQVLLVTLFLRQDRLHELLRVLELGTDVTLVGVQTSARSLELVRKGAELILKELVCSVQLGFLKEVCLGLRVKLSICIFKYL